jgi:hypothetical protein
MSIGQQGKPDLGCGQKGEQVAPPAARSLPAGAARPFTHPPLHPPTHLVSIPRDGPTDQLDRLIGVKGTWGVGDDAGRRTSLHLGLLVGAWYQFMLLSKAAQGAVYRLL